MSRPLRIEMEGGWYHVISRGLERRTIFRDDADRRDFLERLFALHGSHEVRVHAYCLMDNHFHLQLETLRANLQAAMQRLLSGYVVRFNLRHRRAGPLFQGRYRAILAEEGEWRTEVNRYIHLNPVRLEALGLGKERQSEVRRGGGGPVAASLVRERLERLRQFPWSSYRAYAGYIAGPELLETRAVLDCYAGRSLTQRRKNFRDDTEGAIREGLEEEALLDCVRYGVLLGSQEWMDQLRSVLAGDQREQSALGRARRNSVGWAEVVAAVAAEFGEPWKNLRDRRGHPARSLAIVLSRKHSALRLQEIGEHLGGVDYAAVAQAGHRMERKLAEDGRLRKIAQRISAQINSVKC